MESRVADPAHVVWVCEMVQRMRPKSTAAMLSAGCKSVVRLRRKDRFEDKVGPQDP
jgi:hypothetical protein